MWGDSQTQELPEAGGCFVIISHNADNHTHDGIFSTWNTAYFPVTA